MAEEIIDQVVQEVGEKAAGEEVSDTTETATTAATEALENGGDIQEVLESYGFDSIEELHDAIEQANALKQEMGDDDPKALKEQAAQLRKLKAEMKKREQEQLEENETPDETIERLKRENEDLVRQFNEENAKKQETDQSRRIISRYEATAKAAIKKIPEIPKEFHDDFLFMMGLDNPALRINIEDPAQIKKAAMDVGKRLEKLIAKVSKKAKPETPKMTSTAASAAPTTEKTPQTMEERRELLHKLFRSAVK